jgi:hypothetical protein
LGGLKEEKSLATEVENQSARESLNKIRQAFSQGSWMEVEEAFKAGRKALARTRGLRIEAECLAIQAMATSKKGKRAKSLMKKAAKEKLTKPHHAARIAAAHLSLKQYDEAAAACRRAAFLTKEMEVKKKPESPAAT